MNDLKWLTSLINETYGGKLTQAAVARVLNSLRITNHEGFYGTLDRRVKLVLEHIGQHGIETSPEAPSPEDASASPQEEADNPSAE